MATTIGQKSIFDLDKVYLALDKLVESSILVNKNFTEAGKLFLGYAQQAHSTLAKTAAILSKGNEDAFKSIYYNLSKVLNMQENLAKKVVRTIDNQINYIAQKISQIQKQSIETGIGSFAQINQLSKLKNQLEIMKSTARIWAKKPGGLDRMMLNLSNIKGEIQATINSFNELNRRVRTLERSVERARKSAQKLSEDLSRYGGTKETGFYRLKKDVDALAASIDKDFTKIKEAYKKGEISLKEYVAQEERLLKKIDRLEQLRLEKERVRLKELDRIRGEYLSRVARGMESYPFSAHELAKPAEIITTSLFMAGPSATWKQFNDQIKRIAKENGKSYANVFIHTAGQYFKQQFGRAFGAWLGAAFTTFPIFYGALNTLGEINRQYNDLVEVSRYVQSATYKVGGSFESLRDIMKDVMKLSIKTGQSFRTVGQVMWELKSAGFGMKEAIAGTEASLRLVQLAGGGVDAAKSARIVAGMYRLFKDNVKGAKNEAEAFNTIMGKMVYTLNQSQIGFDELLKSFEYFGSTAKATGMNLDQMLAYLSVLSDERLPGVGRAARQVANQIAQAIPALAAKYGIILDATKPLASQMDKVFSVLNKNIKDGTISLGEFSFWMQEAGIRGGPAILAIARNWDIVVARQKALRDGLKKLGMDYNEFFVRVSNQRMEYFTLQWNRLKNVLLSVGAIVLHPVKMAFAEFFKGAATAIENLIKQFEKLHTKVQELRYGPTGKKAIDWAKQYGIDLERFKQELGYTPSDATELTEWGPIAERNSAKRMEEVARNLVASYTRAIEESLAKVGIPEEKRMQFIQQIVPNAQVMVDYIQRGMSLEEINSLIFSKLSAIIDINKVMKKSTLDLVQVNLEYRKTLDMVSESLGVLDSKLLAAASGRKGVRDSITSIGEFGKNFVAVFSQLIREQEAINKLQEDYNNKVIDSETYYKKLKEHQTAIHNILIGNDKAINKTLSSMSSLVRSARDMWGSLQKFTVKDTGPFSSVLGQLDTLDRYYSQIKSLTDSKVLNEFIDSIYKQAEALRKAGKKDLADNLKAVADSFEYYVNKLSKLNISSTELKLINQELEKFYKNTTQKAVSSLNNLSSALGVNLSSALALAGTSLKDLGFELDGVSDPYEKAIKETEKLIDRLEKQGKSTDEARKKLAKLKEDQAKFNIVRYAISKESAKNLRAKLQIFGADSDKLERYYSGLEQIKQKKIELLKLGRELYEENIDVFKDTFGTWEEYVANVEESYEKSLERFRESWKITNDYMTSMWMSTLDRIKSSFEDDIFNFLEGRFDSLGDLFKSFMNDVISSIHRAVAKMINDFIFAKALGVSPSGNSAPSGGWFSSLWNWGKSILGFAEGGYVSSPTFAIVGEKEPEYIIPESKIDRLAGKQSVTYAIYIQAIDSKSFEEYVHKNPTPIVSVINKAVASNNAITHTIRRAL